MRTCTTCENACPKDRSQWIRAAFTLNGSDLFEWLLISLKWKWKWINSRSRFASPREQRFSRIGRKNDWSTTHTHKRTQKTVSERERRHTHDTFHRKKTRCMRVNLRKKQRQPERECEAIKCVHALVVFALVVDPLCHSSSYSLGFRE